MVLERNKEDALRNLNAEPGLCGPVIRPLEQSSGLLLLVKQQQAVQHTGKVIAIL